MNTPINFEASKLLKEKGFDKPTQKAYIGNDNLFVNFEQSYGENDFYFDADDFYENWNKKDWVFNRDGEGCFGCKLDNIKYFEAYAAPIISDVLMWLHEKHGVWIDVILSRNRKQFTFMIQSLSFDTDKFLNEYYDSPTKAYEDAILYVLKNLI